jgi:hypothetical protein
VEGMSMHMSMHMNVFMNNRGGDVDGEKLVIENDEIFIQFEDDAAARTYAWHLNKASHGMRLVDQFYVEEHYTYE